MSLQDSALNKAGRRFTDLFIERPVLATVVSLLILLIGLGSIFKLNLQQYPTMKNTTIIITTSYPGASADIVQGFITTPIESSVASANGIDYMTASSSLGTSTITVYVKLNYDDNAALTEITGKVNAVLADLPSGSRSPVIDKETGDNFPDLIVGFISDTLTPEQTSAYVRNVFIPKVNAVGGISSVKIWGEKQYAMRLWLDSTRMAVLGITPSDVLAALQNNNVQATPGQMKSNYIDTNIVANTDLHSADEFNKIIIKNMNGHLVRIADIGHAELGAENYDSQVYFNGHKAVFAGISSAVGENPLTVVANILKAMPEIESGFPPGLQAKIVYNGTDFIRASIHDVIKTIIEALLIVILVIFLFLGALRSVLIPTVTIPLSLIGVCFLMYTLNFSLNLLTLLAMVLAIGLVVDDAIVVLENIYRHLEEGMKPFDAAIKGAREIANPVIVMTTTLAAVFAPIGFLGGITGALFKEFGFTLAAAVIISGIIALTFSPMMTSKLINRQVLEGKFATRVDTLFSKIRTRYEHRLRAVLSYRPIVMLVAVVVLTSCALLFLGTQKELAPHEDRGFLAGWGIAPTPANLNYLQQYNDQIQSILTSFPETRDTFLIDGFESDNTVLAGIVLKNWSERERSDAKIQPLITNQLSQVAGIQFYVNPPPPLPGIPFGPPVNFVVTTTDTHADLFPVMQALAAKAMQSGLFIYADSDLKFDQPELVIDVDRDKAATLGVKMSDIADALSLMLSGGLVNYFNKGGYSYEVIPQVPDRLRAADAELANINIATASGSLVPLRSLVSFSYKTEPSSLNQFQQLNASTLQAVPMPGVTLGQALDYLHSAAQEVLPSSMSYDYSGQSRQYMQEGNSMLYAFLLALIVIYLVLAAQFESFRDPFIVLVSVPMSICGALIPLFLGIATMNIYTEIGLVTLIGLISKHGILMVEFANKLQEQGVAPHEAIIQAAATRLRPILMTTFAMVFGVVPLLLSSGAGSVSRFDIGLVIACGMTIGTCFTLFVVPTMYSYIAKAHSPKTEAVN